MESKALVAVANELRKQHNSLQESVTARRTELATLEEELSRIDAALAALAGNAPKPVNNGSKAKVPRKTTQTPSAKKADVIAAMRRVLVTEDVLEASELKKQVETQLAEQGFNRFGFAMRWNEACHDPQFVETPEGYRLAHETNSEKHSTATHPA
jgi:hypothetical protein